MLCKINDIGEIKVFNAYYNVKDAQGDRFIHHAENGMMIISACRGGIPRGKKYEEFTDEEKQKYESCHKRSEELKADIRREGLGFIPTLGGYPETIKGTDDTVEVFELSFVVPRRPELMDEIEFVEFALELAKKYDQDSVLISGIKMIANGATKLLSPNADILPDVKGTEKPKVFKKEDFDVEKNPYFTQLKKDPGTAFVIDSYPADKCKRILDYYFGYHIPHGQGGHLNREKSGEASYISGKLYSEILNKRGYNHG